MMRKKYLGEIFNEIHFEKWFKKKVFLNFTTGHGKTTLILDKYLKYCRSRGKKVLILCNRGLLEEQYGFDLAERYVKYSLMNETVTVMTYQHLGQILKTEKSLKNFLEPYDVICCDEAHFFYSDSDFNGFDTYVLAQVLFYETFFRTVIFMTATAKEIRPLIYELYEKIREDYELADQNRRSYEEYVLSAYDYDLEDDMDYTHITPYFVEDVESLCESLAESEGKSIVFIDDKKLAESFRKALIDTGKIEDKDIFILNSEILESKLNDPVIRELTMSHNVKVKVLITTSVLDNGVSVHDASVKNVVIATESRISFMQMLGRVRTEKTEGVNLYIYPRTVGYYEKRITQYAEKVREFERLSRELSEEKNMNIVIEAWYQENEQTKFLKNAVVLTREEWNHSSNNSCYVRILGKGFLLSVNEFSKAKTGDMLLAEKNFLKLCYKAPEEVAKKQIAWIGKGAEELITISSTYESQLIKELVEELMKINNLEYCEFSEKKSEIAKRFQKRLFPDLVFKGNSFENKKFEQLCERHNLKLEIKVGADKKNRYTVRKEELGDAV